MPKRKRILWIFLPALFFSNSVSAQKTDTVTRYYETRLISPGSANQPTLTEKNIDDYSNFRIKIAPGSFVVVYKKKLLSIHTMAELDLYIAKNIKTIKEHELMIEGPSDLKYERFRDLLAVLKKHGLIRFALVTK